MTFELKKLESFSGRKGPLLFIIMDGVGIGHEGRNMGRRKHGTTKHGTGE